VRRALLLPLAIGLSPSFATETSLAGPVDHGTQQIHLLDRLVERERSPVVQSAVLSSFVPVPRAPWLPEAASALDCEHATHDITLDPVSGVTNATLTLRMRAKGKEVSSVSFGLDRGLEAGAVTVENRDTTLAEAVFGPMRVLRVDFAPALAAGQETILTLPYSGTLACAPAQSTAVSCAKSADFAYLAQQSVFPYIFDTEAPESAVFDGMTRDIVLHVPKENEVVATGQKVAETIEGETKISRWSIDKPLSRVVGLYAFAGKLGLEPVGGRPVPTTLVYPAPRGSIDDALVSWSTPALDFVERASGSKLPFDKNLSLVRLPQTIGDPGTATFGMTLLSDSYAKTGDLMYEETWAHENTHLFWGIVVPETDSNESRLMTEGMATLTQVDYSFARHFGSEDRDLYLARRFLPMALDLRVTGKDLPPAVLRPHVQMPDNFRTRRYTMWAYYRPAIILDHLRVTVGEEQFGEILSAYMARCSFVGCRPDVLREIATEVTDKEMTPFFDRWVTGKERPHVRVGFTPSSSSLSSGGGVEVELEKDDDREMTLELWLGLADGSRVKQRVDLGPRLTRAHVDAPALVTSVAASPRHDPLVDVRSKVDGDVDFDGENDGFDLLRCARLTGTSYDAKPASGLWNVSETFDTRCDVNDDLVVDERDLALITAGFGTLRTR
jgi:hypothetical protein